jgi:hypothetical protein
LQTQPTRHTAHHLARDIYHENARLILITQLARATRSPDEPAGVPTNACVHDRPPLSNAEFPRVHGEFANMHTPHTSTQRQKPTKVTSAAQRAARAALATPQLWRGALVDSPTQATSNTHPRQTQHHVHANSLSRRHQLATTMHRPQQIAIKALAKRVIGAVTSTRRATHDNRTTTYREH